MCVCIDIVYHIFLQQRHITHQILAIGAIALRHMHLLPCNAFETMLLKTCPRIATPWNPGPDPQVPAIGADGRQKKHSYTDNWYRTIDTLIH